MLITLGIVPASVCLEISKRFLREKISGNIKKDLTEIEKNVILTKLFLKKLLLKSLMIFE